MRDAVRSLEYLHLSQVLCIALSGWRDRLSTCKLECFPAPAEMLVSQIFGQLTMSVDPSKSPGLKNRNQRGCESSYPCF